MAPRLLILGWDGADWGVIQPLRERGALPHLNRLLSRGCGVDLASFEPRLSPLLWTSAVTGVTPDRHGILNFVEPSPDGQGLRLASSTSRRCRALWNLLCLSGRRAHVVNWYATHPAEPINGLVLSNQFFQASDPPGSSVHPPQEHGPCLQHRQAANAAARACRQRILPEPERGWRMEDQPLVAAIGEAAERAETIHRLSLPLAARDDWDALLVFHEWIDVAGHHAMAYAPPRQAHISPRDQRLFGDVMEAVYREQDRMLGELLAAVGGDVSVILHSDHGFHHGATRPRLSGVGLGDDRAEQEASWHRPNGILVMAGPAVLVGAQCATATLLDITPTALALLDLPAGADMDGRVLRELLRSDPPPPIPSWEEVAGDAGQHPTTMRLDPFEAHEAVKQLIALGYLAAMPAGQAERVAFVRRETDFNRALVLARLGRQADAITILEALLAQQPRTSRYLLLLVDCLLARGQAEAAAAHCRTFLDRQPLATDVRLCLALALRDLGQQQGMRDQIALVRPETQQHSLILGELHEALADPEIAASYFRETLGEESTALQGHLGLARLALARGEAEQAAEHCLDAQALSLLIPEAHLLLALSLAWLGMDQEASLSCGHALALLPQSRAAQLLQAGLDARRADTDERQPSPASNPHPSPAASNPAASGPRERLLEPVRHWICHHNLPDGFSPSAPAHRAAE